MKNIFRKIKQQFETPVTVQDIHNEFDSSVDRLLSEAKKIVSQPNLSIESEALLKQKLGFTKAKGTEEGLQIIKEREEHNKLLPYINYVCEAYPLYKFITEKEIERICKKYGLVFGESHFYKGEIPTKNLLEIESFHKFSNNIKPEDRRYVFNIFNGLVECTYDQFLKRKESEKIWETYVGRDVIFLDCTYRICAPIKDMDMTGYRLENDYKMIRIEDPIVLYPIKGGYLIVSKWGGPEAEDSATVNEKMN